MAKKNKRLRTRRREAERALRRQVQTRERLANLEPGGSPERPIEVATTSVIETRSMARPCPQCGGSLAMVEHATAQHGEERLRRLSMQCRQCHVPRTLWFRIAPSLAN